MIPEPFAPSSVHILPSGARVRVLCDQGAYVTAQYVRPGRPMVSSDRDQVDLTKAFLERWSPSVRVMFGGR